MIDEKQQKPALIDEKQQKPARNIFIFNHHNEHKPAELLYHNLKRLKGQGFNTVCIEGVPPNIELTKSFIQLQISERSIIDSTIHNTFGTKQSEISKLPLIDRFRIYEASSLSQQGVTFELFLTNEGLLAFWKAIEAAHELEFNLTGIDYDRSELSVQNALVDFSMRETRMCKSISDQNDQGMSCIIMLGVAHLPDIVQHLKKQTVEIQSKNLLIYAYQSKVVLDPDIINNQWFNDLRDKSKHTHTSNEPLAVHPFNITSETAMTEATRRIEALLSHTGSAKISRSLLETRICFFDSPRSIEGLQPIIARDQSATSPLTKLLALDEVTT